MREPVGHHGHHHARKDADQADHGPQADDGKRRLPQGQGIHDAREQHLLGDRHRSQCDAAHDEPEGPRALHEEQPQGALVDFPNRNARFHLGRLS